VRDIKSQKACISKDSAFVSLETAIT